MDTDGTVNVANNQLKYTTISERLAENVVELVHSLGGTVSVATARNSYTYKGERRLGRISYTVSLTLPRDVRAFRLDRKALRYHPEAKTLPTRKIKAVEYVGKKEAQCIACPLSRTACT